jgi:hypothetical protein
MVQRHAPTPPRLPSSHGLEHGRLCSAHVKRTGQIIRELVSRFSNDQSAPEFRSLITFPLDVGRRMIQIAVQTTLYKRRLVPRRFALAVLTSRGWKLLNIWDAKFPNAERFKYARMNVCGYALNSGGSWQHQLPQGIIVPVHGMKACRESRGIAPLILLRGTGWRWIVALPLGKNRGAHWMADWVGPRAGLDFSGKEKIFCPYRDSKPGPSSPQRIAMPTTLSQLYLPPKHCVSV